MSTNRILVIEDDRDIRDGMRGLLEMEGYSVSLAGDGNEGMRYLASSERPFVIILDLMLPNMDGWSFLETIKKSNGTLSKIPIIVLTAAGTQKIQDLSVTSLMRKPVDPKDFLKTVQAIRGV